MRALLDVNVLIALMDGGHAMHHIANAWMEREAGDGWASCPITQNGVLRIMSQPGYPTPRPLAQVAQRLALACTSPQHAFWPADVDLLAPEVLDWKRMLGPRQVTDAYLLAIAVRHRGRLATFDQRIARAAVVGARAANLVLID